MRNKIVLFITIGVLAICFIGASVFFALQGISAANKEQEYFDFYRAKAEEYIKSDPEIVKKYGDTVSVKFDDAVTVTYLERGRFDKYIEVFAPNVPDSLEEFNKEIDMIKFNVKINRNAYEIVFEKNSDGELVVSDLTEK